MPMTTALPSAGDDSWYDWGTEAHDVLDAAVLESGNSGPTVMKAVDDLRAGVWEYIHDSPTGYIFHMMTGVNTTASSAIFGIGIDNSGIGIFLNNKVTGIGMKIDQNDTITNPQGYGLQINQKSSVAPAVSIEQQDATTKAMQWISIADGATDDFVVFTTGAGTVGQIRSLGAIHWKTDIITHDGGIFRARQTDVGTDNYQIQLRYDALLFNSAAGSGQFWPKRLTHSGQSLLFQLADTTAGGPDASPTWSTALELKNSSGNNHIGFFGATPVVKPTGVAVTAAGIHAALVSLGLIAA